MTPKEMQNRSGEKVKQVMDLAKSLQLKVEARQRVLPDGFIELIPFWIDSEPYPSDAPEGAAEEQAESTTELVQPEVAE